jgi:hypothetical protein
LYDVTVPPIAPEFRLSAAGATSLKVTWMPMSAASARGVVTKYQITYAEHGANLATDASVVEVDGSQLEYIITGQ